MKLNLTELEALKIGYAFCQNQQAALESFGGYPGEMIPVRDHLVVHINSNERSNLWVMSKAEALEWADEAIEITIENGDLDKKDGWERFAMEAEFIHSSAVAESQKLLSH